MALKICSFQCGNGHLFEGWLRQGLDWTEEAKAGRLSCPICGISDLKRIPDAPNFSSVRGTVRTEVNADVQRRRLEERLGRERREQADRLEKLRRAVHEAEDVGRRFPEEARSMAKGEKEKRILRGLCTSEEAKELRAEGIPCSEIPDFLLEKQN